MKGKLIADREKSPIVAIVGARRMGPDFTLIALNAMRNRKTIRLTAEAASTKPWSSISDYSRNCRTQIREAFGSIETAVKAREACMQMLEKNGRREFEPGHCPVDQLLAMSIQPLH